MINKNIKALLTLVTGLFLCLSLISCNKIEQEKSPQTNRVLKRGNGPDPESLNPQLARSESALTVVRDLYEGLLTRNAKGELVSGAAERWAFNPDEQCYRFYLRADAKWSNGDKLVAKDFVRGFQFAVNVNNRSPYSSLLKSINNVSEVLLGDLPSSAMDVSANSENELDVCMQGQSPAYAIELFALPVTYPRHANNRQVSNGAYQLKERIVGSHVSLIKNQFYHSVDSVYFNEVQYVSNENANSELKRYLAGELALTATIPPNDLKRLMRSQKTEIRIAPVLNTYFYGFNFDKLEIRKALSLAVVRDLLADTILGKGEKPAWKLLPPGIQGTSDYIYSDSQLDRTSRLALAKKIYSQAGYSQVKPLKFELRYNTSPLHKKIAVALAAMWKQHLGVEVSLYNEEWKVFIQSRRQKNTQVFRSGWIADVNDASNYLELFTSGHSLNDYAYANPHYDKLIQESQNATSKRPAILRTAEELLLDDHVIIPLYYYVSKHLVQSDIVGWEDNALDIHLSQDLSRSILK